MTQTIASETPMTSWTADSTPGRALAQNGTGETPVRVLVDAHMLGHRETGNETYVRGLLSGLASLTNVEVAAAVEPGYQPDDRMDSIEWLPLATSSSWRRLSHDLARLCRNWKADVVHATYIAPFGSPCPVVVSVHDLSFRRYPQYFSWRDRALFSTLLPGSLRRAAGILTLSNHTRDELRQFFPRVRAPIHVVPAAPGEAFRPIDAAIAKSMLAHYDLHGPFLLAVGSLQPRKNLGRLIEAYDALRHDHPEIQLAIVGPRGFRSSWVQAAIEARGLLGSVRLLGYVREEELVALYNAAVGLVYPSVYEGFGLPVIEAMACGRPVIAANASSLPEVAGDAALLVDPLDVSALQAAMVRVVSDAQVAEGLGVRGLARAAQFSWGRSAEAALAAYQKACENPFK